MRIGELARVTGCTPRALRHYEEQGLIVSERAANGYRDYDEAAVNRVRNIRHLLGAGLTLEDVQVFLPCLDGDVSTARPSPAGLRVGRERLAVLDARIAAQLAIRDRLAAALRGATTGNQDHSPGAGHPAPRHGADPPGRVGASGRPGPHGDRT